MRHLSIASAVFVLAVCQQLVIVVDQAEDTIKKFVKRGVEVSKTDDGEVTGFDFTLSGVSDRDLKGLEAFPQLEDFNLTGTLITNKSLTAIATIKSLKSLDLQGAKITSDGITLIAKLQNLERLSLNGTAINDVGVSHLAGMPKLRSLSLKRKGTEGFALRMTPRGPQQTPHIPKDHESEVSITDEAVKTLAGIASLDHLELDGAKITDQGVSTLVKLTDLKHLSLTNTEITDQAMKSIAKLKQLDFLSLARTKITDKGLAELTGLTSLTGIDLQRTAVTDAGIVQVAKLQKLESLWLKGTPVTKKAVNELQASIRSLKTVDYSGRPSAFEPGGAPRFVEIEELGGTVTAAPISHCLARCDSSICKIRTSPTPRWHHCPA